MSAAGSHLRHLWGVYPCRGHRRPQDGDKTAADQTASPGNQLLRLGECPLPGPICGICGGYAPVLVIGGPTIAIEGAADQSASPGNQLLRLGECPPPGPICGICGGYAPVLVIGGPTIAIE